MEIYIKGYKVLIDDEDYKWLMSLGTWRVVNNKGYLYVVRSVWDNDKGYTTKRYMHREIMSFPEGIVDHINHNTLDNRKENLRLATVQQNQCNRKPVGGKKYSDYKGVSYCNKEKIIKRWKASIQLKIDGKRVTKSKFFHTEKDAALWYNEKAIELHGEFAYLNNVGG